MKDLFAKAETLTEALPYIKRTWGKTVVIKYGGSAMTDPLLREQVASDIVLMKLVGINPVIVHGGGPAINDYMNKLSIPIEFHDGLRITDDETMEIVKMVLVGKVNKQLVTAINAHGRLAVGISGDDANLISARQVSEKLGRVGEVTAIDTTVITKLVEDGFVPVIATVGVGEDGGSYNINADNVAGEIAAALGAEKLIFLTDVDGLYRDFADKNSLISSLSLDQAEEMMMSEALSRGMIPKIGACAKALRGGVGRAHLLNGMVPHALLLEVYTDAGVGTMLTRTGEVPGPSGLASAFEGGA